MKKINICVVGVGAFAGAFVRCYLLHPLVGEVHVCARNEQKLNQRADALGVDPDKRHTSYEEVLADDRIDAVHILTPTFIHAQMEIQALKAGKAVAVAVSMAETIEELREIAALKRESGKTFMLMETAAFSRNVFLAREMAMRGEFGHIQYIRGSHVQDGRFMGLEKRWEGYPPMLYCTHACMPIYRITGKLAESVICTGSGDVGSYAENYGCRDCFQTALVKFRESDLTAEIHRTLNCAVRQMREHFDLYGSEKSFEWEQLFGEGAVIHVSNTAAYRVHAPDYTEGLPDSLIYKGIKTPEHLWHFCDEDSLEYALRLGHNGAIPHCVHEFVTAAAQGRDSILDAEAAANMTAVGILAVESAKRGGERLEIPEF